ncbi:MAG: hypothetical protein RLO46_22215 [Pseudomonadales bacterium]
MAETLIAIGVFLALWKLLDLIRQLHEYIRERKFSEQLMLIIPNGEEPPYYRYDGPSSVAADAVVYYSKKFRRLSEDFGGIYRRLLAYEKAAGVQGDDSVKADPFWWHIGRPYS